MNHLGLKSDARCIPPFSGARNPANIDLVPSQGFPHRRRDGFAGPVVGEILAPPLIFQSGKKDALWPAVGLSGQNHRDSVNYAAITAFRPLQPNCRHSRGQRFPGTQGNEQMEQRLEDSQRAVVHH